MGHMTNTWQTRHTYVWGSVRDTQSMLVEAQQPITIAMHNLKRNAQLSVSD